MQYADAINAKQVSYYVLMAHMSSLHKIFQLCSHKIISHLLGSYCLINCVTCNS